MRKLTDEEAAVLIKVAHGMINLADHGTVWLPIEDECRRDFVLFEYDGNRVAVLTDQGKQKLKEYLES